MKPKEIHKYENHNFKYPMFLEPNEFLKIRLNEKHVEFILYKKDQTGKFDFSVRHHVDVEKFILLQNIEVELEKMLNYLYMNYNRILKNRIF